MELIIVLFSYDFEGLCFVVFIGLTVLASIFIVIDLTHEWYYFFKRWAVVRISGGLRRKCNHTKYQTLNVKPYL